MSCSERVANRADIFILKFQNNKTIEWTFGTSRLIRMRTASILLFTGQ